MKKTRMSHDGTSNADIASVKIEKQDGGSSKKENYSGLLPPLSPQRSIHLNSNRGSEHLNSSIKNNSNFMIAPPQGKDQSEAHLQSSLDDNQDSSMAQLKPE